MKNNDDEDDVQSGKKRLTKKRKIEELRCEKSMSQQIMDVCDETHVKSLDQRKRAFKKLYRLVLEIFEKRQKAVDATLHQVEIETILQFLLKTASARLQPDALRVLLFILNHDMKEYEQDRQIVDFSLKILLSTITNDP